MKIASGGLVAVLLLSCLELACNGGGETPCKIDPECNTCEVCDNGDCIPKTCDDGIYCTVDVCEASSGECSHIADDGRCPGGACDAQNGCGCSSDADCKQNEFCNQDNLCECLPSCTDKCCGDDGCGGNCPDRCPVTGQTCNSQTCECEGACQPNCLDKECGPDDCGGTCQPGCGAGEECIETTGQCEPIPFRAYVQHFAGYDLIGGMEVRAVDNSTGQELGVTGTSDDSGWVSLYGLPSGLVGFRCVGVPGDWVDTYQFNIDTSAESTRLWAVDHTTYVGIPLIAGITVEAGKGMATGAVYWVNANEEEEPVGCAEVVSDPASPDVRYMGENGLPARITDQSLTHPTWGGFFIANMTTGPATITASVESTPVGSTQMFTYEDSITIGDIYSETATNPTPAGCQRIGPEIYVDLNMRNLCNYNVSAEDETRCLSDNDCGSQYCWFSSEPHFQGKRGFCRDCETDGQCGVGLQCDHGWCHTPCVQDADCNSSEFCTGGFCRKPHVNGTQFHFCNQGDEDLEVYLDQVTLHGYDEACVFSRLEWIPPLPTATLAPGACSLYLTVNYTPKDAGEFRGFIKMPNNSVNYSPLLIFMCGQAVESVCTISEDQNCPECASCLQADFEDIITNEPVPDCTSYF